jgi:hypothetical protein
MNDEIIDEVRAIKEAIGAKFNYDLRALFVEIKRGEAECQAKGMNLVPPSTNAAEFIELGITAGKSTEAQHSLQRPSLMSLMCFTLLSSSTLQSRDTAKHFLIISYKKTFFVINALLHTPAKNNSTHHLPSLRMRGVKPACSK